MAFGVSVRRIVLAAGVSCAIGPGAQAASFGWFWQTVPPRIADGERNRALDVLQAARGENRALFGSPKAAAQILGTWQQEIKTAAHASRLSEALLAALVMVESAGNAKAVSHAGAQGLGQLMPGTARNLGVRDAFHPTQNLRGAASYLSDLLDMFGGDLVLALAAYNAGEGAVMRYEGVPPYSETRAYVPKVLSAFLVVSEFCDRAPSFEPRAECQIAPTD